MMLVGGLAFKGVTKGVNAAFKEKTFLEKCEDKVFGDKEAEKKQQKLQEKTEKARRKQQKKAAKHLSEGDKHHSEAAKHPSGNQEQAPAETEPPPESPKFMGQIGERFGKAVKHVTGEAKVIDQYKQAELDKKVEEIKNKYRQT